VEVFLHVASLPDGAPLMSRRTRPIALFLVMLWLPALAMFSVRLGGCTVDSGSQAVDFHAPASDAGHSASDAEGVALF